MTGDIDYALLDRAGFGVQVFFPRRDLSPAPAGSEDLAVPVAEGVTLGARAYLASPGAPAILYFHGNGEVAADHDDVAPFYHEAGANLAVVDFRGYGRSGGTPSYAALVADAHPCARWFHETLDARGFTGPRFVMGRSLGSQPALEVAARAPERFSGLVIESGAGDVRRLLARAGLTGDEAQALAAGHEAKVRGIRLPVLILHGEWDELIPVENAARLYDWLEGTTRELVIIPQAGHNDILWAGLDQYFDAIARFVGGERRP